MKDKIFEDCLEYYQNGDGKIAFWEELAIKYKKEGYGEGKKNKEKLRSHFHAERKRRGIEKDSDSGMYKESHELKGDGTVISDRLILLSEEDKKSPRRMLELHNLDPDLFDLVWVKNNLWHMSKSYKVGGGRNLLHQSKITAKPKVSRGVTIKDVEEFFENYEPLIPKKVKPFVTKGRKALFVALGDMHFGNDTVEKEMSIEDKFTFTINELSRKIGNEPYIEEVVIATLGDVGHYDGIKPNTSGGTRVESDGSTYKEIYNSALSSIIWMVDTLLEHKVRVRIPYIGGNHDEALGWYLIRSLEIHFRNNPNVIIDSGSLTRKVIVYGNTMIGLTHGNMSKKNQKSWILSYRKEIGKTIWTEILQGHLHHTIVQEENGIIIRNVPAMAGTDKWHFDKGFVGASKATECFLYDKERGQEEIWRISI